MTNRWIFEGRCWKIGDDVSNDGGLLDFALMKEKLEYDPATLAKHTLLRVRPDFAGGAKPGDVLVTGKRFAHGNPHIQGPLGLKGLKVAVVTESVQRNTYRLLVTAGVPFIPFAKDIGSIAEDGDQISVNVETGRVRNLTRDVEATYEPLPPFLLDVIAAGGASDHLKQTLKKVGITA